MLEKFKEDIIIAMKAKDSFTLGILRMVKATMQQEQIDKKKEENEDLLIDAITKHIKMRQESIDTFKEAGRDDLVSQNEKEIKVLEKYLPAKASDEEVDQLIDETISKFNAKSMKDMGIVMKELQSLLKGKTDMKILSEKLRAKLNK